MGECRDCAYSDRPTYKWPCSVCRDTKNGRSMYCPEESDHIANDEIKTDYISREAAIEAISEECKVCGPSGNCPFIMNCLIKQKRKALNAIPPADVRPVARGAWEREMRFRTCSKCGATTTDKDDEGEWIPDNFCPNCGAHMGDDSDAIAKD